MDVKNFYRSPTAVSEGEWVSPGPAFGDVRFKVRYPGPAFNDTMAAGIARLILRHGTLDAVPSAERKRLSFQTIGDMLLVDVGGISEGGAPVTVERARAMMVDPAFEELARLVDGCTVRAGRVALDEIATASEN